MARKTTRAARAAIDRYHSTRAWIESVIRVRASTPEEHWAEEIRRFTPEYIEGYMRAWFLSTDSILFEQGCYHGFRYVGADGNSLLCTEAGYIRDEPEYRDWRVVFYTKD